MEFTKRRSSYRTFPIASADDLAVVIIGSMMEDLEIEPTTSSKQKTAG